MRDRYRRSHAQRSLQSAVFDLRDNEQDHHRHRRRQGYIETRRRPGSWTHFLYRSNIRGEADAEILQRERQQSILAQQPNQIAVLRYRKSANRPSRDRVNVTTVILDLLKGVCPPPPGSKLTGRTRPAQHGYGKSKQREVASEVRIASIENFHSCSCRAL